MKQLSGLDASFLHMESRTTFGHVMGLGIYEYPYPEFDPYTAVRAKYFSLTGRCEPLRRRLVEVPFNLDHPYWVDDPDFDIEYHVREIGLARPGAADQFAEQVARITSRPMDRNHPLWEVYVIHGLADGRWALLSKTHHSTIDGAAGVVMLNMLLETSPDAPPPEPPIDWVGEAVPPPIEMLRRSIRSFVVSPVKLVGMQLRLLRTLSESVGVRDVTSGIGTALETVGRALSKGQSDHEQPNEASVRLPLSSAPPTPWNKPITPNRRFAMRGTALANIRKLKELTGGTVNDIIMAVCTGALRSYLIKHDALPDKPLRAMVPVSIRTGDEEDIWTNRVSGIIAELPTHVEDPLERVRLCRLAMTAAKSQFDLIPAETLVDITQSAPPVIATAASRLASRLAGRVNMPVNVVISNVPGPRTPLYFAGAQLQAYIPVSIVTDGVGLNMTVHSYMDRIDFGLISDRELVPDLWDLADMCIDEIGVLFEACGEPMAVPQPPASMRIGGRHTEAKPGRTGLARERAAKAAAEAAALADNASKSKSAAPAKSAGPAKATRTVAKATAAKATPAKTPAAKTSVKAAAAKAPSKASAKGAQTPAAASKPARAKSAPTAE